MDNYLTLFWLHQNFYLFFTFLLGIVIGSFLNLVIYRLPLGLTAKFNLAIPRSFCPNCRHQIKWYHNIPLFSFLFLRGKCAYCGQKISSRYFWVELISGLSAVSSLLVFGPTMKSLAIMIFIFFAIVAFCIDLKHLILPDEITLSLLWVGLLLNSKNLFISPTEAIWAAALGYLFFWLVANLFYYIRKKEGLGYGDFKLLAAIGAWFGLSAMLNVILLASICGIIGGIAYCLIKKVSFKSPIPFGPFLIIATIINIFCF